jgi:hypothetical protein
VKSLAYPEKGKKNFGAGGGGGNGGYGFWNPALSYDAMMMLKSDICKDD